MPHCCGQDGTDAYAYAKQQKRFLMIKRTEGVSSTDIVGRMLMCTRDNARFREVWAPLRDLILPHTAHLPDVAGIIVTWLAAAAFMRFRHVPAWLLCAGVPSSYLASVHGLAAQKVKGI